MKDSFQAYVHFKIKREKETEGKRATFPVIFLVILPWVKTLCNISNA